MAVYALMHLSEFSNDWFEDGDVEVFDNIPEAKREFRRRNDRAIARIQPALPGKKVREEFRPDITHTAHLTVWIRPGRHTEKSVPPTVGEQSDERWTLRVSKDFYAYGVTREKAI